MDETTRFHLSPELDAEVRASLDEWAAGDKVMRLWARDATLWTGADEASWLGWLGVAGDQLARVGQLRDLADAVRTEGFTQVLVLGMGGSSLCPEVLKMTFGRNAGYPELFVLDSTDPGVSASDPAISTRRGRRTRADRILASSSRSRVTTGRTSRYRGGDTPSAW